MIANDVGTNDTVVLQGFWSEKVYDLIQVYSAYRIAEFSGEPAETWEARCASTDTAELEDLKNECWSALERLKARMALMPWPMPRRPSEDELKAARKELGAVRRVYHETRTLIHAWAALVAVRTGERVGEYLLDQRLHATEEYRRYDRFRDWVRHRSDKYRAMNRKRMTSDAYLTRQTEIRTPEYREQQREQARARYWARKGITEVPPKRTYQKKVGSK